MERAENATFGRAHQPADHSGGNAHAYLLTVLCFYAVFLCGIMAGYFRSERRERRRVNVFTRLVHEEEQREWGAFPKKNSFSFPSSAPSGLRSAHAPLTFGCNYGNHFGHLRHEGALVCPLGCAQCTEESSISSRCSSADTRFAIEEESDSGGAPEGPEVVPNPNQDPRTAERIRCEGSEDRRGVR